MYLLYDLPVLLVPSRLCLAKGPPLLSHFIEQEIEVCTFSLSLQ